MNFQLSQPLRIALVAGLCVLAASVSFAAYRYMTRPTTLTVAAGSFDGEAVQMMTTLASRLTATNSPVRLKVIGTQNALEAAQQFASGKVDLAIVRGDAGDLSEARTVVLLTHAVAMIVVPAKSPIAAFEDLKGKSIGVISQAVNKSLIEALTHEYAAIQTGAKFVDLTPTEAAKAFETKRIAALLVVIPLTEKYLSAVRGLFPKNRSASPGLIPIDSAGAIADVSPAFESYELPKGALRGSPPVPDDDLTTLRIPFYLVAKKSLSDDSVAALAQAIMDTRRDLLGAYPLFGQISAPSTDKDAFIPAHPGASAYFEGNQQSFFDKYGDAIFYGSMLLGSLTSIAAAAWKFMGFGAAAVTANPLLLFHDFAERIRTAADESDIRAIDRDLDALLKSEFERRARGDENACDPAALNVVASRLEHLMMRQRLAIAGGAPDTPAKTDAIA